MALRTESKRPNTGFRGPQVLAPFLCPRSRIHCSAVWPQTTAPPIPPHHALSSGRGSDACPLCLDLPSRAWFSVLGLHLKPLPPGNPPQSPSHVLQLESQTKVQGATTTSRILLSAGHGLLEGTVCGLLTLNPTLKIRGADQPSHLRDGPDTPKPQPCCCDDPGSLGVLAPALGPEGKRSSARPCTRSHSQSYLLRSPPSPLEQQWPFSAGQAALGNEWGQPRAGGTIAGWARCRQTPAGKGSPETRPPRGKFPELRALSHWRPATPTRMLSPRDTASAQDVAPLRRGELLVSVPGSSV